MKVVFLGFGSIARKHAQVLRNIDPEINLFAYGSSSVRESQDSIVPINTLMEAGDDVDFYMITSPTYVHLENLKELIPFRKPIFIEKPAVHELSSEVYDLVKQIEENNIRTFVGYNLRYHPCIVFLKEHIEQNSPRINEVNIYCGSFLPEWRPGKDYRKIYSASKKKGGGVHLDLIHEIDYSLYLFGLPQKTYSFRRSTSALEITSDDFAHYYFDYKTFPLLITLNYYRKDPKRFIEIIFDNESWHVDLLNYTISDIRHTIIFQGLNDPLVPYQNQMQAFIDSIKNNSPISNSLYDSLESLKISISP